MLYTIEGVVIRSIDYGEGHKIITLYTKEAGKVGVMARGAKKMRSRLAAITQLFTYGEYTYYSSGRLGNLNSGEILAAHSSIQEDIYKTAYAAYIVEMIDRMLPDQDGSAYLFDQLLAAIQAIDEGKDAQVVSHLFEMKMLEYAGYSPVLDHCADCSDDSASCSHFSARLGGVLCRKCKHKDTTAILISPRLLHLLRTFQRINLQMLGEINLSTESKAELKRCLRLFMDTHVDINWKSRQFIDQMDKYEL